MRDLSSVSLTISACEQVLLFRGKPAYNQRQTFRKTGRLPTAKSKQVKGCAKTYPLTRQSYTPPPLNFPLGKRTEYIYYSTSCTHNPQDL